ALRVPERKRHDWSQSVMRDCDFCNQWELTVKHENGRCICASCCDAEYTSELKCALESAIDRAEAAENRIAELQQRADIYDMLREDYGLRVSLVDFVDWQAKRIVELEAREVELPKPISVLHRRDFNDAHRTIYAYPEAEVNAALAAAGIGVKGE
ncbi:MAG: hypothetical protein RSC68_31620, partial [Acinetobacter sp.]